MNDIITTDTFLIYFILTLAMTFAAVVMVGTYMQNHDRKIFKKHIHKTKKA